MKPAAFDYFRPRTLDEAVALPTEYGEEAQILAGGQTLVPMMNFRLATPHVVIDINEISGLDFIEERDNALRLGALVRWSEIEKSDIVAQCNPLLSEAVKSIAHYQIRNRGTWAGSCAHADPAAEFPAVALLSDAKFSLLSSRGSRKVSAADFFLGPLTTALGTDEILIDVEMPSLPAESVWGFEEFALRTGDFAIAGVAVVLEPNHFEDAVRAVAFGLGAKACRLPTAESILREHGLTQGAIRDASDSIPSDLEAHADIHASAEYRLALLKVLLERTLSRALSTGGNL